MNAPAKLQKITPALIPHHRFHEGMWLQSVERPNWYYFVKKKCEHKTSSTKFLKSVDGPLRELVKFLHRKKIVTTPSCAGHHIGEKNFDSVYSSLEKDKKHILNGGLRLKDVETGKIYLFADKKFQLPWSREEFIEKVSDYQEYGVLGIKFGRKKKLKEKVLQLRIDGVKIKEEDKTVFIFTHEKKLGSNTHKWSEITKAIKKVFEDHPSASR